MGIMKFFEREVLCFEEELLQFKKIHYTNNTTNIVQKLHFTHSIKKGAPKNTLKNLYYGEYEKISFWP